MKNKIDWKKGIFGGVDPTKTLKENMAAPETFSKDDIINLKAGGLTELKRLNIQPQPNFEWVFGDINSGTTTSFTFIQKKNWRNWLKWKMFTTLMPGSFKWIGDKE